MMKTKDKNQMVQDITVIGGLSPEAFGIFKQKPQHMGYLRKKGNSTQIEDPQSIGSRAGHVVNVYRPVTNQEKQQEREFFADAGRMGEVLSQQASAAEGKKKALLEAYARRMKEVSKGGNDQASVTSVAEESRDLLQAFALNSGNVQTVLEDGITLGSGKVLHPFDLLIHGEHLKGTMEAYQTAKKEGSLNRVTELKLRKEMRTALKGIQEELKQWDGLDPEKISEADKAKFSNYFLKPENRKEFLQGITTLKLHTRAYENALNMGWPISDLNAFTTICEASFREKDPDKRKAYAEMRDKIQKVNYYEAEDPDAMRSNLFLEIERDLTEAGEGVQKAGGPDRLGIVQSASGSAWSVEEKENVLGVQQKRKQKAAPQKKAPEVKSEIKEEPAPQEEPKQENNANNIVEEPKQENNVAEEVKQENNGNNVEEPKQEENIEQPEEEMTDEEMVQEILEAEKMDPELQELLEENGQNAELPADDNAIARLEQEMGEEEPKKEQDVIGEFLNPEEDPDVNEELQKLEEQQKQEEQKQEELQNQQLQNNQGQQEGPEQDPVVNEQNNEPHEQNDQNALNDANDQGHVQEQNGQENAQEENEQENDGPEENAIDTEPVVIGEYKDYSAQDKAVLEDYEKALSKNRMSTHGVTQARVAWAQEALRRAGEIGNPMDLRQRQLLIQATALSQGWNITDMDALDAFVECVETSPAEARREGRELLAAILDTSVKTEPVRQELLSRMAEYVGERYLNADERNREMQKTYGGRIQKAQSRPVQWCEFPEDPELVRQAAQDGKLGRTEFWEDKPEELNQEKDEIIRKQLRAYARQNRNLTDRDQKNIREKNSYVLPEMDQEELERWHKNIARKNSNIEIGSRKAAILTMGPDLYEEADRKYQGSLEERTVPIHHATGTRYNNAGSHVLEIDIGGSGFVAPTHDHHGISAWDGLFDSKVIKLLGSEKEYMLTEEYGERTPVRGHEEKDKIRRKTSETTLPNGKKVTKERYAIPGPVVLGGSLNAGNYSIENTRQVVQRIGEDFLTPIFERWERGEEAPEDIHINISGHSRGGCGAGEGADLIREWLLQNETFNKYADLVKIDLIQLDAVPGYGDRRNHGKLNYRSEQPVDKKQPKINGTAIYSMSTEWSDAMFRPQEIQGADRVIFGMTPHAAGLNIVDRSQLTVDKDGKAHRRGFYDLETGEFYRGSGIAELPEGVYFSDDKQNLIRITNFAQLNNIMDMVCIGADRQMERQNVLRSVVRNWFATHELKDTYHDPEERERVQDQMKRSVNKLMKGTDNEYGLGAVRERLRALSEAKAANNEEMIKQAEEALIKDCRSYMANVPMSATHTERKDIKNMELVGDILSGVQRERNFLDHEQVYTRRNEPVADEVKQQRIDTDAAKANMIRNSVKQQAKDFLQRLNEQDKKYKPSQKNSPEYLRMRTALKECSELSGKSSVREIMDAVSELSTATKHYQDVRGNFRRLASIGGGINNMFRYVFSPSTRQRLSFANDLQKTADGFLNGLIENVEKVYDKNATLQELVGKKDRKLAYEQDALEKMEQLRKDFEKSLLANKMDPTKVEENKQQYRDALADMAKTVPEDSAAGKSYALQQSALQKGWGIFDLRMMNTLADTVHNLKDDAEADQKGRELIEKIRNTQINDQNDRNQLLAEIAGYAEAISTKHPDYANVLSSHTEDIAKRNLHWTEYPKDVVLLAQAQRNGELDVITDNGVWIKEIAKDDALGKDVAKQREYLRDHLQEMADRHLSSSMENRRALRDKDTYVMPQQSKADQDQFTANTAQRAAGISVSNRQAAKCVFGEAEYDQIDRLRAAANAEDRTVKIHHAKGNIYMNEGSHVLEINVCGSGSYLRELDYHGQTGRNTDRDWEESIRLQFGDRVPVPGLEDVNSIRRKSEQRLVNGEMIKRERYTIPGPTVLGVGALDGGKYKIAESRKMVQQIGENFLTPIFKEWKKKQAEDPDFVPKDVHVRLTGYSRGAVAAGYGKNDLMAWINDHPEYKDFAKYVKPESVLFDAVPGPDGMKKGYGENRLAGGNDTVFYMMANEHDSYFQPQQVKGAGKYILGVSTHASGQDYIDLSQKAVAEDGMAHKQGYYDVESGEYYRGGGIADLADGVYFADEGQNLHRLSSFSQLNRLYDMIQSNGGAKKQRDRAKIVQETLKEYFADHELGISYTSEAEKDVMDEKRQRIEAQLLKEEANGKKLAGDLSAVQAAMQQIRNAGPNPQNANVLRDNLLEACKDYMKRTPVTDNADDRRRMDQVSDLCSLIKREKCFEEKGYQPRKNKLGMDEMSKAERLVSGQSRQKTIDGVIAVMTEGGAQSAKLLDQLDATRKSGSDSDEYTRMRNAVIKCAKLDDNASITDIRDAYMEMYEAAKEYEKEKITGLFKTDSPEGKQRINVAQAIKDAASAYGNKLDTVTGDFSEQLDPIWEVSARNQVKIKELQANAPVRAQENAPQQQNIPNPELQVQTKVQVGYEAKKDQLEQKAQTFEMEHANDMQYQAKKEKPSDQWVISHEQQATIPGKKEEQPEKQDTLKVAKAEEFSFSGNKAPEEKKSAQSELKVENQQKNEPKKEEPKKEEPKKEEPKKEEPQKDEYQKAVNRPGWGKNHYFYESRPNPNGGERRKTNLSGLEEKKERTDYSKLRAEKNNPVEQKGKDAAENPPVNNSNGLKK